MIHLPSVGPNCYLAAHKLELGKYQDSLSELSKAKNWGDLKLILQPVVELVVKDALGQYFVDDVRRRFDSTTVSDAIGDSLIDPFVSAVILRGKNEDVVVLKMLLSVGLDPDLSDAGFQTRPSHWCGVLARADLAGLIFPCRPSMKAVTYTGRTPLQTASDGSKYKGDEKHPQRRFLRKNVKSYIETGGFETRFPSLAELAIQQMWFAVKNVLRRRIVATDEFTEKLEGKTAAEWAEFYKELGIAEEIRYYATAPSDRFDETVKQMAALAEKFIDKEDEASVLSSKVMKLDTQVEQLKNEAVAKDAKIEELSEALSVYRTRLEEAGIGFESNNVNSRKSASEASFVGASSSSDC